MFLAHALSSRIFFYIFRCPVQIDHLVIPLLEFDRTVSLTFSYGTAVEFWFTNPGSVANFVVPQAGSVSPSSISSPFSLPNFELSVSGWKFNRTVSSNEVCQYQQGSQTDIQSAIASTSGDLSSSIVCPPPNFVPNCEDITLAVGSVSATVGRFFREIYEHEDFCWIDGMFEHFVWI